MRLGLDFDNTIVCYDALFHRVALEGGWIPPDLPARKTDVRNYLRRAGLEPVWTRLQGEVYGPRLAEASPYPGVLDFLLQCRQSNLPVCLVSHKTRHPFLGQPHDLHQAALHWLEIHGFFNPARLAWTRDQVFLELTKEAKLERIRRCACTHFIDDLPEFLAEPAFPTHVQRLLFDPDDRYPDESRFLRLRHWHQAVPLLLTAPGPQPPPTVPPSIPPPVPVVQASSPPLTDASAPFLAAFLTRHGCPADAPLEPLPGGANNRVYRTLNARHEPLVLKRYFHDPADPRDRFGAESRFYTLAWNHGLRCLPEPLAWDPHHRLGLFRFIPGPKLAPDQVTAARLHEALAFLTALNTARHSPEARQLPLASEACFSLPEHLACLEHRLARLRLLEPHSDLEAQAAHLVHQELIPAAHAARQTLAPHLVSNLSQPLPPPHRCLSPSDFGFHNARLDTDDRLRFFDFEYAGWDDPAKLVCDFFCQPQVPVPLHHAPDFLAALETALRGPPHLAARVRLLLPLYRLKWGCILLNEFLPRDQARRHFATAPATPAEIQARQAAQLAKARALLQTAREIPDWLP